MSYSACEKLVKAGDPDRYLASMRAPAEARKNLMVIYAVNLEIARAPWASAEPMVAQMRLQWWADEINKIYRGEAPDSHEILPALREVIFDNNLPKWLFERLIEARNFDIYADPHKDDNAFVQYIEDTAGSVLNLAARVLGANEDQAGPIYDFAFASGVASLLRAAPELIARGRQPLPASIGEILKEASERLANARKNRRKVPAAIAPAFQAGWRVDATLKEARRRPESISQGLLEESPAWRRFSLHYRRVTGTW